MNQLSETSQVQQHALPDEWVERIFVRMENFYLSLWKDRFGTIPRDRVKQAWAEELAGYTAIEIKRGLDTCKTNKFPPTLPEFLSYCRPPTDTKAEWAEACEQMRIRLQGNGADKWSRHEVYWAAVAIGQYDLNAHAWEQIKTRWGNAIADAKHDEIPAYRAQLPAPGQQSISREDAKARAAELGVIVKSGPGQYKQWAVKILDRVKGGEKVNYRAEQLERECLEEAGIAT